MIYRIFLIALLAALVSACTTTKETEGGPAIEDRSTSATTPETEDEGAQAYPGAEESVGDLSALSDEQANLLSVRTIHFEYDSSEVQEQYRATIEAHAIYLAANPDITVSLEGHADERGSREYNLALGERRSIAVKRQMTLLGVSSSQIRTTSYGEERPLSEEHDEYAWSQNRRVEIIY